MILGSTGIENHPDGTGDVNAIVNGDWAQINWMFSPVRGFNASQDNGTSGVAGTKIRASSAFPAADGTEGAARYVGAKVVWANGTSATVTAWVSTSELTASDSKNVTSQSFDLYFTTNDPKTAIARGLVKLPTFIPADDGKIPAYDDALGRMKLIGRPGFAVAAGQVLYGNGAGNDLASSADLIWDNSLKILTANGGHIIAKNYELEHSTLASGTNVTLDLRAGGLRSINTLAHNVTFATSNRAAGRSLAVRVVCDGTLRTLTFPAGWTFLNAAAPANIAASKVGVLSITCFGANDSDIVAVWAAQP